MDAKQQAAMEAMQKLGSPSEGHQALESLAGDWTYTLEYWMAPDQAPDTMSGTVSGEMVYGGRFLKQEYAGESHGQPFEGTGLTGYDNIRNEYQGVWYDNMATGMMISTGQFDAASKTLTMKGDFSCPMTGNAHMPYRSVWKITGDNTSTYESYTAGSNGAEFKNMEIHYTRVQ